MSCHVLLPVVSLALVTFAASLAHADVTLTWLPGNSREVPRTTSASRDAPVSGLVFAPRVRAMGAVDFAFVKVDLGGVVLRPGFDAFFEIEHAEQGVSGALPLPGQGKGPMLWRGFYRASLALSAERLARSWLGAGGAIELTVAPGHESAHVTAASFDDAPRSGDILHGGGGDFVGFDGAVRFVATSRVDVWLRAQDRVYVEGPIRNAPGLDLGLRWRATPLLQPVVMFLTPIHRQGRSYGEMYRMIEEVILDLDRLGFDEVFLGEHYTAKPEPVSDSLQFFTGLIHRTTRIKFGTGVLALPFYHPAKVAADVAMFDHMSNGRLVMSIGTGGLPSDFELFDVMEAPRGEMMLESLRMIHEIWASRPPYELRGKFWNFAVKNTAMADLDLGVMPKPLQLPHPPIVVSSMMPQSGLAGLAGEHGWGFVSANFVSPAVLKTHAESYRRGAEKTGRTPDLSA